MEPQEESPSKQYLHIGRASELSGRDRVLYRAFEMLPGILSWVTLIGIVLLSIFAPRFAAYFIILFSLYWLLKTIYFSIHLRYNWKRLKHNLKVDWGDMLLNLKDEHIRHLVILPFSIESEETVRRSLQGLVDAKGEKKHFFVVLAGEERRGKEGREIAEKMKKEFARRFGVFLATFHPDNVQGEMIGKGSNIAYAAEEARKEILTTHSVPHQDVIVSAFDTDTICYPEYFNCLTWHFLTVENPHRVSFQPVPFYNNNIWDVPVLSRVVAVSSTFWQMIQQERPEKLSTFSSHSMSFKALYEVGYWQKNMVSEDSRIFWNLFVFYNGEYEVVPISYPVSMDANLAPTIWQTMKGVYKQHRRWSWGVENIPYVLFHFTKNKKIPFKKKLQVTYMKVEGFWSLATHPLILFILGWLPIFVGGRAFNVTVLSYNLPIVARSLLTIAMLGLVVSAIISLSLLPPRPKGKSMRHYIGMVVQWILVPVTMVIFSALPGLDAQTRLLFGRYMGFWITHKHVVKK
ncbi:MAG: glycosyltransferase family 2 protein [Candidatus Paceibacterota bacterium]